MHEAAKQVVRTLRQHGYLAYLVGGCVRDLLLGRTPGDYDVATNATPDEVMRVFPHTFAVGAQFGVVLVPVESLRGQGTGDRGPDSSLEELGEGRGQEDRGQGTGDRRPDMQDETCGATSSKTTHRARESGTARNLGSPYPVPCPPAPAPAHLDPLHAADHPRVIEVATFRNDGAYSDGRHPDAVRFSSRPEEDVQRRDFTINGLLLDPETGEVLDFVGGRADIAHRVIRTIGDPHRRFTEDKLRLLRAVRFAARFGYDIDAETFAAIRELAPTIHQVSRERIREELNKMLTEGSAARAFRLMDASSLLAEVLPEIAAMKGVEQPPEFHPEGDVFVHTVMLLDMLPAGCSKTLAWGALLHDVGKPPTFRRGGDRIRFDGHVEVGVAMAKAICARLRMSNDETDQIVALVANHMRFADAPRMKESTLKKFLRLPRFDEHLALHRLDCLASHGKLNLYEFVAGKLASLPPEAIRPEPLIDGRDLIALGLVPGPQFKTLLDAAEDAQLEDRITTKDEALAFVRELLSTISSEPF